MSDLTNQYTPRTMAAAVEKNHVVTDFLTEMAQVKIIGPLNTKYVELDKVLGSNFSAGYTARNGGPNVVGRGSFTNTIHVAPYVKERVPYVPSDHDIREPGTTVYDGVPTSTDRMVARDLEELYNRLDRLEERQLAEALQTGKLSVSGKDVEYEIDFGMDEDHIITLTGGDMWDATDEKIDQLVAWNDLIQDTGSGGATWMIGDKKSMRRLLRDTTLLDYLDNRRVMMGEINPRKIRGQRAAYLSTLRFEDLDIDLYTYNGSYSVMESGSKTTYNYMNDETIIMGSGMGDVRKFYTKIENYKASDFRGKRFPHFWEEEDGSAKYLQVESGPLVVPCDIDAFVTVKVYTE